MTAPPPQQPTGVSSQKRNPWWAGALLAAFVYWMLVRDDGVSSTGAIIGILVIGGIATGTYLLFRALYRVGEPRPAPVNFVAPTGPPPGWYNNPEGEGTRWWDGAKWTEHVQPPASA